MSLTPIFIIIIIIIIVIVTIICCGSRTQFCSMKKKLTFRKKKKKKKKNGDAVTGGALRALYSLHPTPLPRGKLKEFLGGDVPLGPWSP